MKILFLICILILLTSIGVSAQVVQKYDKFTDQTNISLAFKVKPNVTFVVMSSYSGKQPAKFEDKLLGDTRIVLIALEISNKKVVYGERHDLNFLLDEKRLNFNNGKYSLSKGGRLFVESISYLYFAKDYLEPLTKAKTIEAQFANMQFALTPSQIELIKDFYKVITPK